MAAAVALAPANAQSGILILDQVDDAIQESNRERFWPDIIQTAITLDVQVVAASGTENPPFALATQQVANDRTPVVHLDRDTSR